MQRYVGIDLGLGTQHEVAVLDGSEPRGKPFKVEVSRAGFQKLLQRATEGAQGPVTVVMEPTGLAWVPVAAHVSAAGNKVCLIKPQKAHDLRRFLEKYTKTDPIDADTAARVPQIDPDGVNELELPRPELMELRRLVKRRDRLAQEVGDQKRRVHALMVMVNPPLMKALGESAFSQAGRALLRQYADPEAVVKMGRAKLKKFWQKHSHGPADEGLMERVLQACSTSAELYSELRQNGQIPFDYEAIQLELKAELDWMEHAEKEIQRIEQRIAVVYDRWDSDHTLEQIQGIGAVIAPAIEALVGNILRFHNGRRFVSFSGLCPRKKKSGQSDPAMPITKAGQRLLKKYFYLAADVARQWDPEFAAYYARRYACGDHHDHIIIALARKMALRVYALLKRREQARRAGSTTVSFALRHPETGATIDKKQARQLVLQKYTREAADPARHKRDRAQRGKAGAGPAKKEWPSKDATSKHAAPAASVSQAEDASNRRPEAADAEQDGGRMRQQPTTFMQPDRPRQRQGGWMSAGEILANLLANMPLEQRVDILRKSCESTSGGGPKEP
jgi:transposase